MVLRDRVRLSHRRQKAEKRSNELGGASVPKLSPVLALRRKADDFLPFNLYPYSILVLAQLVHRTQASSFELVHPHMTNPQLVNFPALTLNTNRVRTENEILRRCCRNPAVLELLSNSFEVLPGIESGVMAIGISQLHRVVSH